MKSRVASKVSKACLTMLCDTKADGMSQVECIEASDTTMFQELVQSAEFRVQSAEFRVQNSECKVQFPQNRLTNINL